MTSVISPVTPTGGDVRVIGAIAGAIDQAQAFVDLVPATYDGARQRYGCLPEATPEIVDFWARAGGLGRAVFVLDYVSRLYARVPAVAQALAQLGTKPVAILRTLDHPRAHAGAAPPDTREYSLWFDLDSGIRVELQFGQAGALALTEMFAPLPRRTGGRR